VVSKFLKYSKLNVGKFTGFNRGSIVCLIS
jgi:hypothetical protein